MGFCKDCKFYYPTIMEVDNLIPEFGLIEKGLLKIHNCFKNPKVKIDPANGDMVFEKFSSTLKNEKLDCVDYECFKTITPDEQITLNNRKKLTNFEETHKYICVIQRTFKNEFKGMINVDK